MIGRSALLLLFVLAAAACGGSNAQASAGSGTNYSATPCADNCGNDAQCQASCQDVSNTQVPPIR